MVRIAGEKPNIELEERVNRTIFEINELDAWLDHLEKKVTEMSTKIDYFESDHQGIPIINNSVVYKSSEPIASDDMLLGIYESTKAFHQRFGKFPPVFKECLAMFDEEMREFNFCLQSAKYDLKANRYFNPADIDGMLQEFSDVLVTAMGIFQSLDIDYGLIRDNVVATIEKNNSKTLETHFVDEKTGKISKKR